MTIRTYFPGDDVVQVGIYNEAAAELPKFKAATIDEVRRRLRDPNFVPGLSFYALAGDRPMAYLACQASGRISFPWCRRGHEGLAEPLFARALEALQQRGVKKAFAAYRGDWSPQRDFFEKHGFHQVREMINYVMDLTDMPTPGVRSSAAIFPLTDADMASVPSLGQGVFQVADVGQLAKCYLHNPYFSADSTFVLRSRSTNAPLAFGVVIANPVFADPKQVDSAMPCYRLGAIGTEGLNTKRINGLFSFVAPDNRDLNALALDLLGHATRAVEETDVGTLAAQVPSDALHLARFYKQYFRRQGSFPVFERAL